jgi:hypothetical protein
MKNSIFLLLLSIAIVVGGCKKEQICDCPMPYQIYYLKAKVTQTNDLSCGKPVLDFADDSLRIRSQAQSNSLAFTVINLPANFIVQNQKLYVSVAALQPSEAFACNTLGIPYPSLKIVDAKPRD